MTDPANRPGPERDRLGRAHHPDLERVGRGDADWDKRYADAEQVWSGEPMVPLSLKWATSIQVPLSTWDAARGPTPSGWRAEAGGSRRSTCPTSHCSVQLQLQSSPTPMWNGFTPAFSMRLSRTPGSTLSPPSTPHYCTLQSMMRNVG